MSIFDEQLLALKSEFCSASSTRLPDGSYSVIIPDYRLPAGWSADSTTVRFIAPVGYPISRPDCFWCDHSLRLSGGGVPQNTGDTPLPGGPSPLLWFSWHVSDWSPNSDTLLTYAHVIKNRFHELK